MISVKSDKAPALQKWFLVVPLLIATAGCVTAQPQADPAVSEKSLSRYHLVFQVDAVADPDNPSSLFWRAHLPISAFAEKGPVDFLSKSIRIFTGEPGDTPPLLKSDSATALRNNAVMRDMKGTKLQSVEYLIQTDQGVSKVWREPLIGEHSAKITLTLTLFRPLTTGLSLEVSSLKAVGTNVSPPDVERKTALFTLKEVRAQQISPAATLTSVEEAIPVKTTYSLEDLKDGAGSVRDESKVILALQRVAWLAFSEAKALRTADGKNAGIAIGEPSPFKDEREALDTVINGKMVPKGILSGFPHVGVVTKRGDGEENSWTLSLRSVPLLGPFTLTAVETPQGGVKLAASVIKQENSLIDKLQDELKILNDEMTPGESGWTQYDAFNKRVRGRNRIASLTYELSDQSSPAVKGSLQLEQIEQSLSAKGGASYRVEEGLSGIIALKGNNLLRQNDVLSLDFKGGDKVQAGTISAQGGNMRDRTGSSFTLSGTLSRNGNQRLGNAPGSTIEDKEGGLDIAFKFDRNSFSREERNQIKEALSSPSSKTEFLRRLGGVTTFETKLERRDIALNPEGAPGPSKLNGSLAALTFNLGEAFSQTPSLRHGAGITRIEGELTGSVQTGLDVFGGDYRYALYSSAFTGTVFLGGADRRRDILLRYKQGFASGSGGTPIFRLPRIGGAESIRGIEEGEFVANHFAYRNYELGFNLPWIGQRFSIRRHRQPADAAAEAQPQGSPSPLANAYLKFFYDSGRTLSSAHLGDLLAAGSNLEGYGVAIELNEFPVGRSGSASFSFGYAQSRNSLLHRSGTFFTGVTLKN